MKTEMAERFGGLQESIERDKIRREQIRQQEKAEAAKPKPGLSTNLPLPTGSAIDREMIQRDREAQEKRERSADVSFLAQSYATPFDPYAAMAGAFISTDGPTITIQALDQWIADAHERRWTAQQAQQAADAAKMRCEPHPSDYGLTADVWVNAMNYARAYADWIEDDDGPLEITLRDFVF